MKTMANCNILIAFVLGTCLHYATSHIQCNEHYFREGDFILSGLFDDLHYGDCDISISMDDTKCIDMQILYSIEAMAYAVEKVNNRTDLLANITLGYDIYDTCGQKTVAISHVVDQLMKPPQSQCDNTITPAPIIGAVGAAWSSITTAITPIYGAERFHLPTISPSSSSDELSDQEKFPYFLRLVPADRYQIQATFDILELYDWTSVSFVYTDDSYGRNALKAFKECTNMVKHLVCVANEFAVTSQNKGEDYDYMVQSILDTENSPVVILFTHSPYAKQFLEAMKRKDAVGKLQLIAGDGWGNNVDDDIDDSSLDAASGLIKTRFVDNPVKEFEEYFYNHILPNHNNTSNPWMNAETRHRLASLDLGQTEIAKRMDSVLVFAYALQELISLECPHKDAQCINELKRTFKGRKLFNCMKKVNFLGYNKYNVSFNSMGELRAKDMYDIVNLRCSAKDKSCELKSIGRWSSLYGLSIPDRGNITFGITDADGIPQSYCEGPPLYLKWDNIYAIILISFSSLGLICTVIVALSYAVNINHDLIRASGPGVSFLILSGVFLSYLLVFALIAKPSTMTCYVVRIGMMLCFTLVIGPLLIHANTIFRRYRAVKRCIRRPKLTSPSAEIFFSLALILIQVFITIGFLMHTPPETEIIEPIPRKPELTCNKNKYELMGSLTYNILLIIICSVHAFLTRHVPKNFNESRFIGFSIYTTLVIWLFFIPAYIMVPFSNLKAVIVAAALIINATVTLIFLFVVKLYALLYVPFLNIELPHKATEKSWPDDAAKSWMPGAYPGGPASRRNSRKKSKSRVSAVSSKNNQAFSHSEGEIVEISRREKRNFQEQSFYSNADPRIYAHTQSLSYQGNQQSRSMADLRPPPSLSADDPFKSFVSTWL